MWRVGESGWKILGVWCAERAQVRSSMHHNLIVLSFFYLMNFCSNIVNCSLPEEPSNGAIVDYERLNETVLEGTVLSYQCDNGLSLTGPNNITCTNAAVWSTEPEAIICVSPTEGELYKANYI